MNNEPAISEGKLVFIPESKWQDGWYESGGNKAGDKLYTKLHNACKSSSKRYSWQDKSERVVEYKLVATGNIYDNEGNLIDDSTK